MLTSARNQFKGTVTTIKNGPVNAEVHILLRSGDTLVAIITHESVENLELKPGSEVYALVKAPWVILAPEVANMKFSTRNRLCGTVVRVTKGALNSEVELSLDGDERVNAIVTNESIATLAIKEGARCCALFKASSVILAVPA